MCGNNAQDYLSVVWVGDNEEGVVGPRQDVLSCVIPGYGVDLRTTRTQENRDFQITVCEIHGKNTRSSAPQTINNTTLFNGSTFHLHLSDSGGLDVVYVQTSCRL